MYVNYKQRGLVLVTVLWVVVLLIIMTATMARTSRLHTKLSYYQSQSIRCQWGARAGLETALALLDKDIKTSDSKADIWCDNKEQLQDIALDGCSFSVRVVDESGKLNVNTATKEQLMALPHMTEAVADAIIDWRDKNHTPGSQGVETGYYRNLNFSYDCSNAPFKTIRELLLIKGVTEQLFYGEDINLNGKLDYNEKDGDTNWPPDNADDTLDCGWISFLTCYSYDDNTDGAGNKRVNINTADEKTLTSKLQISAGQARWIIDNRKKKFKSVADLLDSNRKSSPGNQVNTKPKRNPARDRSPKRGSSGNQIPPEPLTKDVFVRIVDRITVSNGKKNNARVNINTAPLEVLSALFGRSDQARELAWSIIDKREALPMGFSSVAGLLDIEKLSMDQFKKIVDIVTVRSSVFCIYSTASSSTTGISRASQVIEAVVDRGKSPHTILYHYQGANF